jgi:hypothetical protein
MATVQDVKLFISDYAEWQYKIATGRHDHALSDEEHEKNVDYLKERFYAKFYQYIRTQKLYRRLTKVETEEEMKKQLEAVIKRKVFLIREYKGAVIGKGIIGLDNNTIYSCFIGQDDIHSDNNVYMTNVIVGTIDKELRIITIRQLDSNEFQSNKKLKWIYTPRSFELENEMILKSEGKLVDVLRILEPGHSLWIEDYNS